MLAKERHQKIRYEKGVDPLFDDGIVFDRDIDPVAREGYRAAEKQARQELGDIYQLIDIGEPAAVKGLMKELEIKERLDGLISKCLKQLLMVRGVKSLSADGMLHFSVVIFQNENQIYEHLQIFGVLR